MANWWRLGQVIRIRGVRARIISMDACHDAFLVEDVATDADTHLRRWLAPGELVARELRTVGQ